MNEEQIVARVQREVTAHRTAVVEQRWCGRWHWLGPVLALTVLVAFFAAPGLLSRKLLLAMSGVCALRPDHSFFAGGVQLPLESRMMGIYGGFLLTLTLLLTFRRIDARRPGNRVVMTILALMFASMAFDGINSTLAGGGVLHLYTPTNTLRLLTGLLAGIAIAPVLVWLLGVVALPRDARVRRAVVQSPWELAAPLALNAAFAALIMDGHAAFYYPLALIGVAGVVAALGGVALLVMLTLSGLDGRVLQLRQVLVPGAWALLLTLAALASLAAIRWTVTQGL
jgi:uncharacterized membrane protein